MAPGPVGAGWRGSATTARYGVASKSSPVNPGQRRRRSCSTANTGHARPLADGELQSLGRLSDVRAGAQRYPPLGGVEEAEAGAVDPQGARDRAGQPHRQQLGPRELRLGGGDERGLEPLGDAHA